MAAFPSKKTIGGRAEYLRGIGHSLIDDGVLSDKSLIFRTNRVTILTDAYFLLNEAYKGWRISKGHHTQPPKIAALTCMAIATLQPFLPKNPETAKTFQQARGNEIYALACASAIMGITLHSGKRDIYLRLLDVLSQCNCHTVEPLIVDRATENNRELSTYKLKMLDKDKFQIDCLITIFEMAWLSRK